MTISEHVCDRCGLPVRAWGKKSGETFWKHSGGYGSRRSCGQPPDVISRALYEDPDVQALRHALRGREN